MNWFRALTAAFLLAAFGASAASADVSDEYTEDEVFQASSGFFADASRDLADAIAKAFEDHGRPNAYITGEEVSAAIGIGLRYGNGTLTRKKFDHQKIYWQGPTIGFDLGGDASKVFILIYHLEGREQLYQRIPGVDGSAYLIGGIGISYLGAGDMILAPIQTGVGLRLGINVGYLHFSQKHTWNPF